MNCVKVWESGKNSDMYHRNSNWSKKYAWSSHQHFLRYNHWSDQGMISASKVSWASHTMLQEQWKEDFQRPLCFKSVVKTSTHKLRTASFRRRKCYWLKWWYTSLRSKTSDQTKQARLVQKIETKKTDSIKKLSKWKLQRRYREIWLFTDPN